MVSVAHRPRARRRCGSRWGPGCSRKFVVGDLRAASFEALPLGRWVHLAGVVDCGTGARLLRRRGARGREPGRSRPRRLRGASRSGATRSRGKKSARRASLRDLERAHRLRSPLATMTERRAGPRPGAGRPRGGVSVPRAWFADRSLRPRVHPMPPAGWTKRAARARPRRRRWRLYHQANPNGAFWDHIFVWGGPSRVRGFGKLGGAAPGALRARASTGAASESAISSRRSSRRRSLYTAWTAIARASAAPSCRRTVASGAPRHDRLRHAARLAGQCKRPLSYKHPRRWLALRRRRGT